MTDNKAKRLICHQCRKYLGEISEGRLRKGTHLVCRECAATTHKKTDMPDFLKGLRKGQPWA